MMKSRRTYILTALLIAGVGAIGCSNENGAGGTTDGTSAEAYELNSGENIAPSMDSVKTAAPDSAAVQGAAGDSTVSGA